MSIPLPDFISAITSLHNTWRSVPSLGGPEYQEVTIVKKLALNAVPFLRIKKLLPFPLPLPLPSTSGEPEHIEPPDPEALPPPPPQQEITVTYEIIHSPTYLVPVLYITLPRPVSTDELYSLLVPPLLQPTLSNESIGVLGGLSATTHPETGRSCFWVHPCRTSEAMQGRGLEGTRYLVGWLGMVGGGVGLVLPVEVGRRVLEGETG